MTNKKLKNLEKALMGLAEVGVGMLVGYLANYPEIVLVIVPILEAGRNYLKHR